MGRVPAVAILEAIKAWKGNLRGAADELGLRPKNLYDRLDALGIGPDELFALRHQTSPSPHGDMTRIKQPSPEGDMTRIDPHDPPRAKGVTDPLRVKGVSVSFEPGVSKSEGDPVKSTTQDHSFGGVGAMFPVRPAPPKQRPFRLKPDLQDKVNAARLTIYRETGLETENNDIVDQCLRDNLDEWLEKIIGHYKAPASSTEDPQGGPR